MLRQIHDRDRPLGALTAALATLGLAVLAVPGAASAAAATNSTISANWSGYAAHGAHVHFDRATGIWRVPKLTCVPGRKTYSAVWVGLGGYALNASALEQTGTETDCERNGSTRTTAWFEVVPAPSRSVRLNVRPGDLVSAAVTVSGLSVTLTLRDLTTQRHFTKQMLVHDADTSSAEWIVEAPSNCSSGGSSCTTLPLADFGSVRFTHAAVQTLDGQSAGIVNRRWRTTKILLRTHPAARSAAAARRAKAAPSALRAGDEAFSVVYQALSALGA